MRNEKQPVLYQLLKDGLNLELAENELGKYGKPIIDLIKESPIIVEQSKQDWEYKSLAQMGREEFSFSHLSFWEKIGEVQKRDWFHAATRELSQDVCRWIYYVDEGLRIYVKSDSGFIPATRENKDYEFVMRLNEEDGLGDLSFTEPPSWANNLYLNKKALRTWELFYYDLSVIDLDLAREMRRNAINHFLDNDSFQSNINYPKINGSISNKERDTLLVIIASMTQELGTPIGATTIENKLKEIPQALENRAK